MVNTLGAGKHPTPDAPLAKYARAWLLQDGTIEGLCNRINAVHAADRLGGPAAVLNLLGVDHMAPLPRNWRQHGGRRVLQWFTP